MLSRFLCPLRLYSPLLSHSSFQCTQIRFIRTRSQSAAKRKAKNRFLTLSQRDKRARRNKRESILDEIVQNIDNEHDKLQMFREFYSKHTPILFGRVQAMLGASILVADTTPERLSLPRKKRLPFRKTCFHKGKEMKVVCGDEVVWWPGPTIESPGKVMKLLPRKNVFARTRVDWKGNASEVILASNIAQMAIIIAPRPRFNTKLLDRYLAAARECHIPVVIIFNKMDLMPSSLPHPQPGLQNDNVDKMMQAQIESFIRKQTEEERVKEEEEEREREERKHEKREVYEREEIREEEEEEDSESEKQIRRAERIRARQAKRLTKREEGEEHTSTNSLQSRKQDVEEDEDEEESGRGEGEDEDIDEGEEQDEDDIDFSEDDEGRFDHYDITEEEWLQLENLLTEYHKLNYAIFRISSKTGEGTEDLKKFFDCRSPTLLVGQTGSGKSALLNVLCPDLALSTRTLSGRMQGRHTTTTILEHILPSGCRVMDSPGFSNYGPRPMPPTEVANTFVEFQGPMQLCRYPKRCLHINEQDCGVRKAVELGIVSKSRYESYVDLVSIMEKFWNKYRKNPHPSRSSKKHLDALKFTK